MRASACLPVMNITITAEGSVVGAMPLCQPGKALNMSTKTTMTTTRRHSAADHQYFWANLTIWFVVVILLLLWYSHSTHGIVMGLLCQSNSAPGRTFLNAGALTKLK